MRQQSAQITARIMVFGEMANATAALAQAISSDQAVYPALQGLSAVTRNTAIREISTVGAELLDLDLGSLLVTGWRRYSTLVQAARRTAAMPGRAEIVDIVTHRINVACHPSVELLINDVRMMMVNLDLTLEFEIKALAAVVKAGQIVALDSGRSETTASVAIEGIPVATRTADFDLHLLVHLGTGIPLLPPPQNSHVSHPPFQKMR
jgi:hypothetical protein